MYVLWEYMCASLLCKVWLFVILVRHQFHHEFRHCFHLNEIGEFFFFGK